MECFEKLKLAQSVHVPIYDFKTHRKSADSFRQVRSALQHVDINLGFACFMRKYFPDFLTFPCLFALRKFLPDFCMFV